MYKPILFLCIFFFYVGEVKAQKLLNEQLFAALKLSEIIKVLSEEGIKEATEVARIYLQKKDLEKKIVEEIETIYDNKTLEKFILLRFRDLLSVERKNIALDFLNSPLGNIITNLETSARVAMSDEGIEKEAIKTAIEAKKMGDARIVMLEKNMSNLNLIEHNLVGTLSAQYAFMSNLAESTDINLTQSQIIAGIEANRKRLRSEISDWLLGYGYMAYKPLADLDLKNYFEFIGSETGLVLNDTLFNIFNNLAVERAAFLGEIIATALDEKEL